MIQTKEEMFLAELGINPKEVIQGFYGSETKITELLKKHADQQLTLTDVSQQRELLAFRKWQRDNWKDVYLYSDEFMTSEFKKANSI